jgi:hypothetical protein
MNWVGNCAVVRKILKDAEIWFPAISSSQFEVDFASDQVDDRREIAK